MRRQRASEESSMDIVIGRKSRNSQQNQHGQDQQDTQDPVNCPLIFKACLITLLTIGILAFIITFSSSVQDSSELYTQDFSTCPDSANVRRLSKFYAYEKMILGLSISGLILSFGLSVFLIIHAYDFCRCFDGCYARDDNSVEEQSQGNSQQVDIQKYQTQLQKRIQSNLVMPKNQIQTGNIILSKKISKPLNNEKERQSKSKVRNKHIRQYLKSPEQIKKLDQKYGTLNENSDQLDCDCQCDDCESCLTCCLACLWCRTCFQAHHYRFYKTKNQQYAYWVVYLVKTLFFGTALAYVIRLLVSLNELQGCQTDNSKKYISALQTSMVIGIITVCIDVIGYFHLLIEGSLLEVIEDTLNQEQKSQHSRSDQESDQQSDKDAKKKKKSKKYQDSSSSDQDNIKHKKKKPEKRQKKQLEQKQSKDSQQEPSKNKLFGLLVKDSDAEIYREPKSSEQKVLPSAKQTDNFFINLRTLGNRYMEDIDNEQNEMRNGESDEEKNVKKNKKKLDVKQQTVIESEESYPIQKKDDKKPQIHIPKEIDKLPKPTESKTKMVRQQDSVTQEPFWKNQLFRSKNNNPQDQSPAQVTWKQKQKQKQKSSNLEDIIVQRKQETSNANNNKFGAFNRGTSFNKEPQVLPKTQKNKSLTRLQNLSKFSTKF